jgi:hypothetical protein
LVATPFQAAKLLLAISIHLKRRNDMETNTIQGDSPMTSIPSGVPTPRTTEVMVLLTAKQGVSREQIMKIIPAEIRATVKLYLDGKIRQWYSRGDGRGVVLFFDAKTLEEAHGIVDTMPLSKENLVDHEYIPIGPLLPLGSLIDGGPQ